MLYVRGLRAQFYMRVAFSVVISILWSACQPQVVGDPAPADTTAATGTTTNTSTTTTTGGSGGVAVGAVSPTAGALAGGAPLDVIGANFVSGATVQVGGSDCTPVTFVSSSRLRCTLPPKAAGTYPVVVTLLDSTQDTLASAYTYDAFPTLSGVSPSSGPAGNITFLTIGGTGFLSGASVTVGGAACNGVDVLSGASLTCYAPGGAAGSVDVVVTNLDTQARTSVGAFTYVSAPTVQSVSPTNGVLAGANTLTLSGLNFVSGATVKVGANSCAVTGLTSSAITCTAPAGSAGTVDVVVTNPDSQIARLSPGYTYNPMPTVVAISPNSGPVGGGGTVTIYGSGFLGTPAVKIGANTCASPLLTNSNTLTCTLPGGSAGAAAVKVTNPDTQAANVPGLFTYNSAPTLSGVSPSAGPASGTTTLTLSGGNFVSGATVTVAGSPCTGVTVVSSTTITCIAQGGSPGAAAVAVTNSDGQSISLSGHFAYDAAPTVTSISPTNGPLAGTNTLTISGTNFIGGSTVKIGSNACAVTGSITSSTITCTVPSSTASTLDVVVTQPDSQVARLSPGYTYNPAPTIAAVSPNSAPVGGGGTLTVSGSGFLATPTIKVGPNTCANPVFVDSNTLTCTIPAGSSGAATVTVTNPDTQAIIKSGLFVYGSGLTIASISPTNGKLAGGDTITITGTGFVSGAMVKIQTTACGFPTVQSSISMTCNVPQLSAGIYDVVVTNPDTQMQTLSAGYTYNPFPTVASASPITGSGNGGDSVTLTGTGFLPGATVSLGGTPATGVNVTGGTSLNFTTPAHAAGGVDIVVTNLDTQSGTLLNGFTYLAPPIIASISPTNGKLAGGGTMTISGSGFVNGATVTIGAASCASSPTVVNSGSITCPIPSRVSGGTFTVTVTNPNTLSGTYSGYTYNPFPTVSTISPALGPTSSVTAVTITGTGFISGPAVTIGGAACLSISVASSTSISCMAPGGGSGAQDVTVTNPDTQPGTLLGGFTYNAAPTLASISPINGRLTGSNTVTLTGTGFITGATVTIGGFSCGSLLVGSTTSITCAAPSGTAGTYAVVITNPDGQNATLPSAYTYNPVPTISGVSPTSGPAAGGGNLTVSGTGFLSNPVVTVGGNPCNVSASTSSSITCQIPAGSAGAANVIVVNTDTQSFPSTGAYTYVAAPTISTISPTNGKLAGGDTISITGTGFVSGATVKVNGITCTSPSFSSASLMTCHVPVNQSAGPYDVVVTNPDAQTGTKASGYTYNPFPTVASVSPTLGPNTGGTSVTLTGTGFLTGATVTLGGVAATGVTLNSSTSITVIAPAGSNGVDDVTVINADTQSGTLSSGYTYVAIPTISSIVPNNGKPAGGDSITINGTNFLVGATVTINGTNCVAPSPTILSATQILCTTPAKTAGSYDVVVTNPNSQSATSSLGFTYNPAPTISSITPNNGSTNGGTSVTLAGTGFLQGATVTIGGNNCSNISVASGTSLTCVTPAGSTGTVSTVVTNPDGQTFSLANSYTYALPSADPVLSQVMASAANAPADISNSTVTVIAIPRDSGGVPLGTGQTVELTISSANVTLGGGSGTCVVNVSTCTKMTDSGGGAYVATGYVGSAVNAGTYTFSAVVRTPTVVPLPHPNQQPAVHFDSTLFTTFTGQTVTSANANQNLYFTSGTNTFDQTTEGATFGDIFIRGTAIVKHLATTNTTVHRLMFSANSLNILGTGAINVDGLGYTAGFSYGTPGPSNSLASINNSGASHGGKGGNYSGGVATDVGPTYDNYRNPTLPGSATTSASSPGGGVVQLNITGPCVLSSTATNNISASFLGSYGAAGGTINLKCGAFAGLVAVTNMIIANGSATNGVLAAGGGGRIALISSGDAATFTQNFTFPSASGLLTNFKTRVRAYGGTGNPTYPNGAAGTVFLKHSALSYGVLSIDNGSSTNYIGGGTTFLPSLAGTVNGTPTSNSLPITVTSTPTISPSYNDLYIGLQIRPDLTFTNGTPTNWADDNVLNVSSSNSTNLITSNSFSGVASGASFRSIDILDYLDLGGSAQVETNGDIYAVNGALAPASAGVSTTLTNGIIKFAGSAAMNPAFTFNLSSGTFATDSFTTGNLNISGATVTVSNLNITNALTVSGGTLNHPATTASKVNSLNINVTNSFTLSGGAINVNNLGYLSGYSFGSGGPGTGLISSNGAGASHGGRGAYKDVGAVTDIGPTYDDYRNPSLPGAGTNSQAGGGVVRMTVNGPCVFNSGTISANATGAGAAGGSIYLNCTSFSGTAGGNTITATGGNASNLTVSGGGGGRIALISTGGQTSFSGSSFAYPTTMTVYQTFRSNVNARGGLFSTASYPGGGAGTVFLKHSGLTYGALIVDSGNPTSLVFNSGTTFLPSLAGTVSSTPSGGVLPVSVTSTPALGAAYAGLYAGLRVRPNLAFNNGTPNNWADDNVLTVSTNDASSLTMTNAFGNISSGQSFRSIDLLDNLEVGGSATLESNGDIYLLNGSLSLPNTGNLAYTDGFVQFDTAASCNTALGTLTLNGGNTYTLNSLVTPGNFTISSSTINVSTLNVNGSMVMNNGATLSHPATTTAVIKSLQATLAGTLTMNSGSKIDVRGLGFPVGYSYGPNGVPITALESTNLAGPSHGGRGGYASGGTLADVGPTYDDYRNPSLPGAGSLSTYPGGGVVRLTASGICTVNSGANIYANAGITTSLIQGAGGSIYLNCAGFVGNASAGAITADGGAASTDAAGGGGRIALISTGDATTFGGSFAFPVNSASYSNFKNTVHASGGNSNGGTRGAGGAGTVYLKHSILTYGALIVDNSGNGNLSSAFNGDTFLPSLAGTIGTPAGSTLPVTVTSAPGLSANFANLYAGMRLRPDLSFTNSTPSDWTDDNILTVASNNASSLTMTAPIPGSPPLSSGLSFRSIDILDNLEVTGSSTLLSNGDIYVLNGDLITPGAPPAAVNMTDGFINFNASAGLSRSIASYTFSGGFPYNLGSLSVPKITISNSSTAITATSLATTGDFSISNGTVTTGSMSVSGNLNITGGTVSSSANTVTGDFNLGPGTLTYPATTASTLTQLVLTVGGNFHIIAGGTLSGNGQGYPIGFSYGNAGPSASLASANSAGGSHGGKGGYLSSGTATDSGPTYDDYRNPTYPGGGGGTQGQGGGAIRVTTTGLCTIDSTGNINASANSFGSGAGGSIYMKCGGFNGSGNGASGNIVANGSRFSYTGGGGGRIALISTGDINSFSGAFAFPATSGTLSTLKGIVQARGGSYASTTDPGGGAGTVYLRHSNSVYGTMIIDNTNVGGFVAPNSGTTFLPSLAGTIGTPSGSTLPVTVTSSPALNATYTNLYKGMLIRPDLSFTNGTASDWSDDNILTVFSNDAASLTMTAAIPGSPPLSSGKNFRTIDIYDNLEVSGGATVESNGDIYVVNGQIGAPDLNLRMVDGFFKFDTAAAVGTPAGTSPILSTVYNTSMLITYTSFTPPGDITIGSGGPSITATTFTIPGTQNFTMTNGTLTVTNLNIPASFTLSGGTVSVPALTVPNNLTMSGGTVITPSLNVTNSLTMTGGVIQPIPMTTSSSSVNRLQATLGSLTMSNTASFSANGMGYYSGNSFASPSGIGSALAAINSAGASHGGRGGFPSIGQASDAGPTYDDYRNPNYPGAGAFNQFGGGVIRLNVTGACQINSGAGVHANAGFNNCAGGSIYMNCSTFTGSASTGAITADGWGAWNNTFGGGGGGRIALITPTGDSSAFTGGFGFPNSTAALSNFVSVVHARGGGGGNNGGAGTVYLKHSLINYGVLLVDNGGTTLSATSGTTLLVSMAGTVNGTPSGTTLPVSVTSAPTVTSNYNGLFVNMMLRPDLGFNNTTPNDWSDDNVLTVASNSTSGTNTTLTTTSSVNTVNTVANGASFRSIDILDYLGVGGGATLETNGDIYLISGQPNTPTGGPHLELADGFFKFNGGAGQNLSTTIERLQGGYSYTLSSLSVAGDLALSGNTNLSVNTLTVPGSLTISGTAILTHPASTTAVTNTLQGTVGGNLSVTGSGEINVDSSGYPSGYSYASTIPSTALASSNNAGGSHGGRGGYTQGGALSNAGATYDDYRNPSYPGGGGPGGNVGGGAIHLTVAGSCTVDSNPGISASPGTAGAGGSIYLQCASFGGASSGNAVRADGGNGNGYSGGGGGRIALISTSDGNSFTGAFSLANTPATLTSFLTHVHAYGGAKYSTTMGGGAAGTIYIKHTGLTNGDMIIGNGKTSVTVSSMEGTTDLISATDNGNKIYSAPGSTGTATVTNGGTPYTNKLGLFADYLIHIFTGSAVQDPINGSFTAILLSGNGVNTFTTAATFPVISNDYNYRFVYQLDHLDVSGYDTVTMTGADLVLNGNGVAPCDLHSTAVTVDFDVSTGSSLTGNSLASSYCRGASHTTTEGSTVNFTNYFQP